MNLMHPSPPTRRALLAWLLAAPLTAAAQSTPDTRWEDLVPKGWDPMAGIKMPSRIGLMNDSDPQVLELMRELRASWDNAPTRGELNDKPVRLSGYVVPLEQVQGEVKEFLLVPYFGACIHTPPPPANQIVHVLPAAGQKAARGLRTMDVVTVQGKLRTARVDSAMGASGYRIDAAAVEPYRAPATR